MKATAKTDGNPVDRRPILSVPLSLGRRVLGLDVSASDQTVARWHGDEPDAPGLNARETGQLRHVRRLGATGAVLMAIGALGAGAQPVLQNPIQGVRILGLPARIPTTALTMAMTGTVLVVLAWLLLGRFAVGRSADGLPPRRMSRSQLDRTLLLWILPLTIAPPMFSRDVYSYLAQSEITARGLDPYSIGPGQALGLDNVLTRTVPTIWRDTPAPYGPLFLWIGRGISAITGDNIVFGIFLHRLCALAGVALIVWALPRLAKRCGVASVSALWLGAANPLLIFHLVSGVHNEALMLGLMLAGIEFALRAIEKNGPITGRDAGYLLAGTTLMALSTTIKITSILALAFIWMALARRWGPSVKSLIKSAAYLGAVTALVIVAVSFASGLGLGWLSPATLGTANAVRSWMSLPTSIGIMTGFGGVLLGLGDHTTAVLSLTRPIAAIVAGFIIVRMLIAAFTGRIHPVGALGVAVGALVLLFPVVQPWYLLWAVIPLAAWATRPAFRIPTVAFSSIVCVILMPNGAEYKPFVIVQAAIATIIVCSIIIAATRNILPWRGDAEAKKKPDAGARAQDESSDAYAESS